MALRAGDGTPVQSPDFVQALPGPPGGASATVLPINLVDQHPYSNLCWAACAAMVLSGFQFEGHTWSLCELTSAIANSNTCYTSYIAAIDEAEYPSYPYRMLGFSASSTSGYFNPAQLDVEIIQNGRPVQVFYQYSSGGGHTALIVGSSPEQWFEVNDPWYGSGWWGHQEIVGVYGLGGVWLDTLYAFGVSNGAVT